MLYVSPVSCYWLRMPFLRKKLRRKKNNQIYWCATYSAGAHRWEIAVWGVWDTQFELSSFRICVGLLIFLVLYFEYKCTPNLRVIGVERDLWGSCGQTPFFICFCLPFGRDERICLVISQIKKKVWGWYLRSVQIQDWLTDNENDKTTDVDYCTCELEIH